MESERKQLTKKEILAVISHLNGTGGWTKKISTSMAGDQYEGVKGGVPTLLRHIQFRTGFTRTCLENFYLPEEEDLYPAAGTQVFVAGRSAVMKESKHLRGAGLAEVTFDAGTVDEADWTVRVIELALQPPADSNKKKKKFNPAAMKEEMEAAMQEFVSEEIKTVKKDVLDQVRGEMKEYVAGEMKGLSTVLESKLQSAFAKAFKQWQQGAFDAAMKEHNDEVKLAEATIMDKVDEKLAQFLAEVGHSIIQG